MQIKNSITIAVIIVKPSLLIVSFLQKMYHNLYYDWKTLITIAIITVKSITTINIKTAQNIPPNVIIASEKLSLMLLSQQKNLLLQLFW